mmetsp:Transcript_2440/g.6041  ORF Transcript_2440/g.6041 Transcript_2440/m.6041 type:complete len:157 (-) Transcript_2440:273-743(-)
MNLFYSDGMLGWDFGSAASAVVRRQRRSGRPARLPERCVSTYPRLQRRTDDAPGVHVPPCTGPALVPAPPEDDPQPPRGKARLVRVRTTGPVHDAQEGGDDAVVAPVSSTNLRTTAGSSMACRALLSAVRHRPKRPSVNSPSIPSRPPWWWGASAS